MEYLATSEVSSSGCTFSLPAYVVVVHLQLPNAVSLSEQSVRPEMCPNFGDNQNFFSSSLVLPITIAYHSWVFKSCSVI